MTFIQAQTADEASDTTVKPDKPDAARSSVPDYQNLNKVATAHWMKIKLRLYFWELGSTRLSITSLMRVVTVAMSLFSVIWPGDETVVVPFVVIVVVEVFFCTANCQAVQSAYP